MLNQDTLIVKIGRNRGGDSVEKIDMAVDVRRVMGLCDFDFQELLNTLESARKSCLRIRHPMKYITIGEQDA